MINKNELYFGTARLYQIIKEVGGEWNDSKERPLVCLIQSSENEQLFWAIPVGNYNHRDTNAQNRIQHFVNRDTNNISSCYYHIGKTTTQSIFFICDVIPITSKYIEREYLGYDGNGYVIKNKGLINELERKLKRILSHENSCPNYFRQHITDIKNYLLNELPPQSLDFRSNFLGQYKAVCLFLLFNATSENPELKPIHICRRGTKIAP